jgi:hypothetical protein
MAAYGRAHQSRPKIKGRRQEKPRTQFDPMILPNRRSVVTENFFVSVDVTKDFLSWSANWAGSCTRKHDRAFNRFEFLNRSNG